MDHKPGIEHRIGRRQNHHFSPSTSASRASRNIGYQRRKRLRLQKRMRSIRLVYGKYFSKTIPLYPIGMRLRKNARHIPGLSYMFQNTDLLATREKDPDYNPEMENRIIRLWQKTPVNIPVIGFWPATKSGYEEYEGVQLAGKYGKFTIVNTWAGNYSFHSGTGNSEIKMLQRRRNEKKQFDPTRKYVALTMIESGDAIGYIQYGLGARQWDEPERGPSTHKHRSHSCHTISYALLPRTPLSVGHSKRIFLLLHIRSRLLLSIGTIRLGNPRQKQNPIRVLRKNGNPDAKTGLKHIGIVLSPQPDVGRKRPAYGSKLHIAPKTDKIHLIRYGTLRRIYRKKCK